jgi:hypothetical protein
MPPQCLSGFLRQIAKFNPDVALRTAGKIRSPHLLALFRQLWIDAVRIERLGIRPTNFGGRGIDQPLLDQLVPLRPNISEPFFEALPSAVVDDYTPPNAFNGGASQS